jgi:hypothetical protein
MATVLVVDDEGEIRSSLRGVLSGNTITAGASRRPMGAWR